MSYEGLLTDAELEYLQSLLNTQDQAPTRDARFTLQGSDKGTALLRALAADHALTLEARADNVLIRFTLRFEADSLGNLHLSLHTPRLTEAGLKPRTWRALLTLPITLKDRRQQNTFLLHELSASGAVLEFHTPAPKHCEFLLPLASISIAIRARRIRYLPKARAAYRIFTTRPSDLKRLRAYIFYLYQRQRHLP